MVQRNLETTADDDQRQLTQIVERALAEAARLGASAAESAASRSSGLSVTVRLGEVETVEHNRDNSLVVTVYLGNKTGSASTSDFSPAAVTDSVRAACSIARHTADDPCAGLADREQLATEFVDLDLYHPWSIDVDQAIQLARRCEDTARSADERIKNSEGATVNSHSGVEVYANSHGFVGPSRGTRHAISCAVVGEHDGRMQRDYWYSAMRAAADLDSPEQVGELAAKRTLRRLDSRKIKTTQCPVIYEAPIASSLLAHFVGAVRGSSLYRKASFLVDHLGKPVFAPGLRIHEQPHLPRAMGSACFDAEGVATHPRDLVRDGILEGYVLDSYSARKLGMTTTGNAGGVRNLTIESGDHDFQALLRTMDSGLLVTELIGSGINMVTGDYSRGAAGFWIEGGEIQYPVEEITIAGNLKQMFTDIAEIGNDVDVRGNVRTGSILLSQLTVAGE